MFVIVVVDEFLQFVLGIVFEPGEIGMVAKTEWLTDQAIEKYGIYCLQVVVDASQHVNKHIGILLKVVAIRRIFQ